MDQTMQVKTKKNFLEFLLFIYSFRENGSNSVVMVQLLTLWILKANLSWQLMSSTKTIVQNYPRSKKHFIFIVRKSSHRKLGDWNRGETQTNNIFRAPFEFEKNDSNCVV